MHLFAGSYERFLFGYSLTDDLTSPFELKKKYTFAAHKNAIKCVATAGSLVASGGNDDLIHLYDMKTESDLGVLINPGDGAIPCLDFFIPKGRAAPTHLLSGSGDGGVSVWQAGPGGGGWQHLKVLKGHRAAVNSISVHSTGKLALSTARDGHIRMWNLVKGRGTYTARLDREGEIVKFSPSGEAYALAAGSHLSVHSVVGEGALLTSAELPKRIQSLAQQSDELLMLGLEDGSVRLWDTRVAAAAAASVVIEKAHATRVRGLAILSGGSGSVPEAFASASSDGVVKVWDSRMLGVAGGAALPLASADTRARLTCLAAVVPPTLPTRSAKKAAAKKAAVKAAEALDPTAAREPARKKVKIAAATKDSK